MEKSSLTARIVNYFIDSKLTPILIIVTLFLGLFAILKTPKEEEPQIVVPMIDIFIQYPGAEPEEVEKRVVTPLEKKLWELKDIEYIYSVSRPGMAVITARFYVGTDPVKALVELNSKWMSALDLAPPGVILPPLIKPKSIDDVPILSLTLWGPNYDGYSLRRMASLLENEIKKLERVSEITIIGGYPRQIRIILDPAKLEAYRISPLTLANILKNANAQCVSGKLKGANREYVIQSGEFFRSKEDVERVIVGFYQGKPVYLKDVAEISDGPSEVKDYVFLGLGPSREYKGIKLNSQEFFPAVTIAIAKRKGTNAVEVAEEVLELISKVRGKLLPSDVHITVTRNYGETAKEKADELLEHLFIATFAVTLLIAVSLGIREAFVVGIAVPVTLAMALFLSMLYGFTLNRVTLFALIFCIGILVDDPIVDVENIHRWFKARLASNPRLAIIGAVNEVRAPIILATFTVIAALMPMAFVSGLMGPYMRPIPINASVAMLFSLIVALVITPWAAYRFLTHHYKGESIEGDELPYDLEELKMKELKEELEHSKKSKLYQVFAKLMYPLLISKKKRYLFYLGIIFLLLASLSLFYFKLVLVKMLPYDNKSEVQIVLDMPEGTPLEKTLEVAKAIGRYLQREKIVTDLEIYVGTSSPFNFNGLVRHYYLRQDPNQADIQVNLIGKHYRKEASHDFAKRIRPKVHEIAKAYGAKYVAVVEVPPGPPVLSPIVAEIYAPDLKTQETFARKVLQIFKDSPLITDEGIYLEDPVKRIRLIAKEEYLKIASLSKEELVQTLKALCSGLQVGVFQSTDTEHVPIILQLDEKFRTLEWLRTFRVATPTGELVPLRELVEIKEDVVPTSIYHKNLRRVTYVIGDTAEPYEAPVYGIFDVRDKIKNLPNPYGKVKEYWLSLPVVEDTISIKWDGEMHITLEVFRDLGLAFAVAIFIMYVLILTWFKDYRIPGVIMAPIPLTLFGIIPGHFLLNSFFTATSMIGFIALAGIIVRNSILVVDFAEQRVKKGVPLHLAVVEAAAIRTRPILLTASGVIVGAFVILFDPIFNGLAISLIFGTIGSTLLSTFLIPLLYFGHKVKIGYKLPDAERIKKDLFD